MMDYRVIRTPICFLSYPRTMVCPDAVLIYGTGWLRHRPPPLREQNHNSLRLHRRLIKPHRYCPMRFVKYLLPCADRPLLQTPAHPQPAVVAVRPATEMNCIHIPVRAITDCPVAAIH